MAADQLHLVDWAQGWEVVGAPQMVFIGEEPVLPIVTVGGDGGYQAALQPHYGLFPYPLPLEEEAPTPPPGDALGDWPEEEAAPPSPSPSRSPSPSPPTSPLLEVVPPKGEDCEAQAALHSANAL